MAAYLTIRKRRVKKGNGPRRKRAYVMNEQGYYEECPVHGNHEHLWSEHTKRRSLEISEGHGA